MNLEDAIVAVRDLPEDFEFSDAMRAVLPS